MRVSVLILAGGHGDRMNGQDKGLVKWHEKTFIDRVIERVGPQVDDIAISANRNLEEYAKRSAHVFSDAHRWRHLGPLAGLATASNDLQLSKSDWVLVVPCDTLHLPHDLVKVFFKGTQLSPLCSAF